MENGQADQNSDTESRPHTALSEPESYATHPSFKVARIERQGDNLDSVKHRYTGSKEYQYGAVNQPSEIENSYEDWRHKSQQGQGKQNGQTGNPNDVITLGFHNTSGVTNQSLSIVPVMEISQDGYTENIKWPSCNGIVVENSFSETDTTRHIYGMDRRTSFSDRNFENLAESRRQNLSNSGSLWPLAEGKISTTISQVQPKHTYSNRVTPVFYDSLERSSARNRNLDDRNDDGDDVNDEEKGFRFRDLTKNQIIILIIACLTNLITFLSLSVLEPFFPLEAEEKGVNNTISGWVFGIFALVQFITSPLFGRLVPIVGSRFMYLTGLFVCGGCTLLFGILDKVDTSDGITIFLVLCFATRVLLALGCTAISNAFFVMLVKAFPDSVATVFGIGEIFTGIGLVTGPALGGFLYSAGGFILPFAAIGGCCFLALPVIWFFLPIQDDSQTGEEGSLSWWSLITHPRSVVNSIVIVVAASVWAALDPTLEPHLRVYGLGPEMVGVLFLITAGIYSVSSPLWGRIVDKLSDTRLLQIPGMILCALGLLLSGPSPVLGFDLSYNELWLTIVSLLMIGLGSSMSIIPTYDIYICILNDLGYPEDTRTYGMVSGLWVAMYALGEFAGPSLSGFAFEEVGFEWMATGVAGVCILTMFLVIISWIVEKKCCRKRPRSDFISTVKTERKHLLAGALDPGNIDDTMRTYPPGSLYTASFSTTLSECNLEYTGTSNIYQT